VDFSKGEVFCDGISVFELSGFAEIFSDLVILKFDFARP